MTCLPGSKTFSTKQTVSPLGLAPSPSPWPLSLLPQETVVGGLGYDTPRETVTAYREALDLRPFMDDNFRSEAQEVGREEIKDQDSGGRGDRGCLQKWLSVLMYTSKESGFLARLE